MITEKMIEAARSAVVLGVDAKCEPVRLTAREARAVLEAALSMDAEPVSSRNDEAGYVEFVNEDVPYIVREIEGRVAILANLETRNVLGYRVYDPEPTQPAPSVAVKVEWELIEVM